MLFLHVPLQSDGKFPIIQTEIIPESSYAGGSDMNTIFIGIAAVMTIVSIMEGMKAKSMEQFSEDILFVKPGV